MKDIIHELYRGDGDRAHIFRTLLFLFDISTIGYFIYTATAEATTRLLLLDLAIAIVVLTDLSLRLWIAERRVRYLLSVPTLADIIVVVSLLAPVLTGANLGFFKVLRVLRLMRVSEFAEKLNRRTPWVDINPRVVTAATNLLAFIFVVTSLVWVWEHGRNENMQTYIDALYFTITTLTTTGYGDITLTDPLGRVMTIGIMIFGVGFFLKLLQALYRPNKVEQCCGTCGLSLHERDASHCKHCGSTIYIETEGAD
ncbi:ion channel [Palleronia sp. LCG004]|uniref:ion channel n=1 Tax=Palleronia sp. LCG004 TaxID=3079304 RepID=UPI002943D3A3|nr:ion channel [Palleronia sp. LCG004]WOI57200.1 ion channel [Palleronia sp. LCG004]